jgi:superfamily II DNA or RNA helicase
VLFSSPKGILVQIIDNRALLFITKKADQITALIPKSKIVERNGELAKVLVNWGHEEAKLLRNMQIKNVPHPITGRYKWAGVYTPFEHQRVTAGFLATHHRCLVLSEAGTGKTAAAAWAADYLMQQGEVKRVLIVCPVSIMDTAWRADLFRTVMSRTVAIATGSRERREKLINGNYEFVIINFDGIKVVRKALEAAAFDLIIVDECTAVKNTQTDRWKALNHLLKPTTRLWLMTGTPAAQSPVDAYGLAKLVDPSRMPRFYGTFRDLVMYKVTQYKWAAKRDAQDTVFKALQPAIRYTKEECLDLPDLLYTTREVPLTPQQQKYYDVIKKSMVALAAGSEITAVNAAGLLNKLLQISCIAYNTPVLTGRGWVPIQEVSMKDLVWDGDAWVAHSGLISRGVRAVMDLDGVLLTPEHEVYTNDGWKTANDIHDERSQGARFDRTDVRLPNGYSARWDIRGNERESPVGVPVSMWNAGSSGESILTGKGSEVSAKLRLSSRKRNASCESQSSVPHLGEYETSMQQSQGQRLDELWWAGRDRMLAMAAILREFLGRYARNVFGYADARSTQRQRELLQGKLPVGNLDGARQQQAHQSHGADSSGAYDRQPSREALWDTEEHVSSPDNPVRMDGTAGTIYAGTVEVFDILQCGPQTRFVVRGNTGRPMLVHNCGAAYTTDKEVVEFDVSNRMAELEDVIQQTTHKVIVFIPFRHAMEKVQDELSKRGYTSDCIHGGVPASQRAEIIKRFQTEDSPRIILLIPQAAAHGLTLTKADTVVWWGPTSSAEMYIQGNARAHRAGQTNKVTVVRIQGSPVERRMYDMLDGKVDMHQGLVDLYKQEIT